MKQGKRAIALLIVALAYTIIIPQKLDAQTPSASATLADSKFQLPDSRVKVLTDYLRKNNSPLADYAPTLVKEADNNNIDWRLLTAISGVESTYAQAIPQNSYNAWGWGIYGDQTKRFGSWEEAIATISKGLRENYVNKLGTDDVYAIGHVYAASPTWAVRVEHNLFLIDRFSQTNPAYTLSLSI